MSDKSKDNKKEEGENKSGQGSKKKVKEPEVQHVGATPSSQ